MPSPRSDAPRLDRIDEVLDEFYWLARTPADPELDAVLVAVFVEDAFGVTLTDDEIDPAHLSDRAAVRDTVKRHLDD